MLHNLAEDPVIEEKMTKRNIVMLLANALDAEDAELLAVGLTFLKKLSIYKENKNDMLKSGILDKILPVLDSSIEVY